MARAELAQLIQDLNDQMLAAARELQFELAARIRDEVRAEEGAARHGHGRREITLAAPARVVRARAGRAYVARIGSRSGAGWAHVARIGSRPGAGRARLSVEWRSTRRRGASIRSCGWPHAHVGPARVQEAGGQPRFRPARAGPACEMRVTSRASARRGWAGLPPGWSAAFPPGVGGPVCRLGGQPHFLPGVGGPVSPPGWSAALPPGVGGPVAAWAVSRISARRLWAGMPPGGQAVPGRKRARRPRWAKPNRR